jgi:hypothetical protein
MSDAATIRSNGLAMSSANVIANYLRPYVSKIDVSYQWRFDEKTAAAVIGSTFDKDDSWYSKTIKLKKALRKKLSGCKTNEDRVAIAQYFIADWGGVKTNSRLGPMVERFTALAQQGRSAFETIDLKGVSSWSKYVSLILGWAPIYDSRVAYSINAICLMAGETEKFFPIPDGRSPRLNLLDVETLFLTSLIKSRGITLDVAQKKFSSHAREQFHIPSDKTYCQYIELLSDVANILDLPQTECFKIEMLLFSLAPTQVLPDFVKYVQTRCM